MTGGIYDGDNDLDYQDYSNFRMGYTHIKRVLLRLRKWPREVDETSTIVDRMKVVIRETLETIAKYLAAFLEANKEKCTALKEAWDDCEMDMPTKEEFAQGLKRVRDDIGLDSVDGLKRGAWKKLKQCKLSLAGVYLNCATSDVTVLDCGPPSLGLIPSNPVQVMDDPWREVRPYQQGQLSGSMEVNVPIDPPGMEDPPLAPSLVQDVLTDEEMYNIATECGDSTTGLGESDNPIVL